MMQEDNYVCLYCGTVLQRMALLLCPRCGKSFYLYETLYLQKLVDNKVE